jgi:hypothetical protein
MEKKLKETNLVTILLHHDVLTINSNNNIITSIQIKNRNNDYTYTITGNNYILAIPPKPLLKLLKDSSVKDAFKPIEELTIWTKDNSYFEYVPVTLHWKNKIDLPKIWGFPASDWGLAYIILSNYMKFDKTEPQMVISTAITYTDRKSSVTNKTADESDINEIYTEVLRQLRLSYPDLPNPDYTLVSPQVYKNNDKWINIDTAYVTTSENQYLPFNSKQFKNLYNCGVHNGKSKYYFTALESSVSNSLYLYDMLEPNSRIKRRKKTYKQFTDYIHIGTIFIIILIGIYLYRDKLITFIKNNIY